MFSITRYSAADGSATVLHDDLGVALAAFASCAGFTSGAVARCTDDPNLFTMVLEFDTIGSYRRALSSFRVKAEAVPVMYHAVDEPSAYEPAITHDGTTATTHSSDIAEAQIMTP